MAFVVSWPTENGAGCSQGVDDCKLANQRPLSYTAKPLLAFLYKQRTTSNSQRRLIIGAIDAIVASSGQLIVI